MTGGGGGGGVNIKSLHSETHQALEEAGGVEKVEGQGGHTVQEEPAWRSIGFQCCVESSYKALPFR